MATDITKKFTSAVKSMYILTENSYRHLEIAILLTEWVALAPGELVKDEHFTLFESVAALEVNTKILKDYEHYML